MNRASLQRNRALWASLHLRNYTFRIRFGGFPIPGGYRPMRITVRNGRPSSNSPRVLQGASGLSLSTVSALFREIRHVLDDPKAGNVSVHYDRTRGFPSSASIDPIKAAVDDEFGWTIDQLRPLRSAY